MYIAIFSRPFDACLNEISVTTVRLIFQFITNKFSVLYVFIFKKNLIDYDFIYLPSLGELYGS